MPMFADAHTSSLGYLCYEKYRALISGMSDFANLNDYTACRQTLNGKLRCIHIH